MLCLAHKISDTLPALWTNTENQKKRLQKMIQRQKQHRGSAIPLRVKGYPLNLDPLLS